MPPRTRLYINQPLAKGVDVVADEKQAHYLTNVMRLKPGDEICLFNGHDGEWLAKVVSVNKKSVAVSPEKKLKPQIQSPDLWLIAAPLRAGKTEYVMEKATELGISRLLPVSTQFTVAKSVNPNRLTAIAVEASEQCERMDIPVIEPLVPFTKLLGNWDKERKIIYGDESGAGKQPKEIFPHLASGKYAALIGPEGGFSPTELDILKALPFTLGMCMGPRIMRADTAAIAAITLIQSWLGDWDSKPAFRA